MCALFLLFTAFLTDYLGLYVDQWKLSQLKKENKQLEKKFVYVEQQLKSLEKRVHKISDFSRKLQLITNASPEQISKQMGFGKIHSSSAIVDLASRSPVSRNPNFLNEEKMPSFDKQEKFGFNTRDSIHHGRWEVRIENLKGKSELVKQSAWALFTDLLEKQEILNSTPSILPVRGWVSSDFGYRNETIYSDHEPHFHRGVDIASQKAGLLCPLRTEKSLLLIMMIKAMAILLSLIMVMDYKLIMRILKTLKQKRQLCSKRGNYSYGRQHG